MGVYDDIKADYNDAKLVRWYAHTYDSSKEFYNHLEMFLKKLSQGAKILDAGSGIGKESAEMARQGFHPIAIDFSPEMISVLKKKYPKIECYLEDIRQTRFKNMEFDGVWCCRTIFHIMQKDVLKTLREFHRVLKKDGYLAFMWLREESGVEYRREDSTETNAGLLYLKYIRTWYSKAYMENMVQEAGFHVEYDELFDDKDKEAHVFAIARKITE